MKELTVFKLLSKGSESKSIRATKGGDFFSSYDLKSIELADGERSDTLRLSININTEYHIPEGYYCPKVSINNFRPVAGFDYKRLVDGLKKIVLAGEKLSDEQRDFLVEKDSFTAVLCDVTFPNGEKVIGHIAIRGTLGNWKESWEAGNKLYDELKDKPTLLYNIARIVEPFLDKLEGRVVMFRNYNSADYRDK